MNVIAIPFFFTTDPQRRAVTAKVFRHYQRIADNLGLIVVGVGSEGSTSRGLFEQFFPPEHYVEYRQRWHAQPGPAGSAELRKKFDATIQAARTWGPDRVFILGSDDVLTERFFELGLSSDADLVGVGAGSQACTRIVRLSTGEVVEWDGRYPAGEELMFCAGCLGLSRSLLDRWRWAPFSLAGDEVGVERRAAADGATCEAFYARRDGFDVWNVKSERVLNSWANVLKVKPKKASRKVRDGFHAMWAEL